MRCAYCDAEFTPKNQRRRFCSEKYRCASWQEKRRGGLARLEDRLSVALAEVQACGGPMFSGDDRSPSSADNRPPGSESPIVRACPYCGAPALRTAPAF